MDKNSKNKENKNVKVGKEEKNKDLEDYGYDFVPHLNEWLNIDEQQEKVEELEDI